MVLETLPVNPTQNSSTIAATIHLILTGPTGHRFSFISGASKATATATARTDADDPMSEAAPMAG